ncbi:hypothetical protein [Salinivibrio sp. SS2]|uniref:hypothetical protein n=1 Tax=Salinivibrio sp. SS2 TaxID=1892894 RepID=UPI00084BE959|nr:hypothetical protein [Salinivibrio sp. DV]ODP99291.1 hypothetical protein BGK46_11030 [Salinivibrio sp. DV]
MTETSHFPKRLVKVGAKELSSLLSFEFDKHNFPIASKALGRFKHESFQYDFYWAPKEGATRIFVLLSGDARREKNDPPVFQRWSWAEHFPGHCLYISDPTIRQDDNLGLAWYSGNESYDPFPTLLNLIKDIAKLAEVDLTRVTTYGSSGGGFAAMRLGIMEPKLSVVTINPQVDITKYWKRHVNNYLKVCWNDMPIDEVRKNHPLRMSNIELAKYNDVSLLNSRMLYIQNTLDEHHFDTHLDMFCKHVDIDKKEYQSDGLNIILFDHEGGHGKAETPECFTKAMNIIENWN